jgi:hypothetical protein
MTERRMKRQTQLVRTSRSALHARRWRDIPRSLFASGGADPEEMEFELIDAGEASLNESAEPTRH